MRGSGSTRCALTEIARCCAPVAACLVRNLREDAGGWRAALRKLLEGHTARAGGSLDFDELCTGEQFASLESREVPWSQHLARQRAVDIIALCSDVITLPARERDERVAQVSKLLDTHPDLVGSRDVATSSIDRCYGTPVLSVRLAPP